MDVFRSVRARHTRVVYINRGVKQAKDGGIISDQVKQSQGSLFRLNPNEE